MGKIAKSANKVSSEIGLEEIPKNIVAIIIKSPIMLVALGASFFFGYGISFVLFDYRRATVEQSHYFYHIFIGIGYSSLIFLIINWDLISKKINIEQITDRIPLTLLISFSLAFVIMLIGSIWRELSTPYSKRGK